MIHSKSKSSDEILRFAQHYKKISAQLNLNKTLVCVPTTYNQTTEKELASAGFQIIIHANHLLRSAYKAMMETAQTILRDQRSFETDPLCSTVGEIFKTVGFLDVKEKDQENKASNKKTSDND